MNTSLDETHNPALQSWVPSANDPSTDFPIQNLPYGRFRDAADPNWRIGVAIGNQVLDLTKAGLLDHNEMHKLMRIEVAARRQLRQAISAALRAGSPDEARLSAALVPQDDAEMNLPCQIGDYTDFYTSLQHATAMGKLFRPDEPLLPNYKWMPVAYHGRASSIGVSAPGRGASVRRPLGQVKTGGREVPELEPTRRMDFELELAAYVGRPNVLSEPIPITAAENHLFGLSLMNDWTARDIQAWESQPLGPFLSKSFATTVSPWIVTLEALEPFRTTCDRPADDPPLMQYLDSPMNRSRGAFDIHLQVWLLTERMREDGHEGNLMMSSNASDAYWTFAQLIAHHTINGCNLRTGDLLGSGTLSNVDGDRGGSMAELSHGGRKGMWLSNGEKRLYLRNHDTVIMRGRCARTGWRSIGFGECRGTVAPARYVSDVLGRPREDGDAASHAPEPDDED